MSGQLQEGKATDENLNGPKKNVIDRKIKVTLARSSLLLAGRANKFHK